MLKKTFKKDLKQKNRNPTIAANVDFCREDGIRTHDTVTHIQTFQACSFNHSDTSLFGVANNCKKIGLKK